MLKNTKTYDLVPFLESEKGYLGAYIPVKGIDAMGNPYIKSGNIVFNRGVFETLPNNLFYSPVFNRYDTIFHEALHASTAGGLAHPIPDRPKITFSPDNPRLSEEDYNYYAIPDESRVRFLAMLDDLASS